MFTHVRATIYIRHDVFFRARLLVLNSEEISNFIDQLEKEAEAIRKESMKLAWCMRGGIQYGEVLNLSFKERLIIADISKENLETTKTSGLPFF